MQYLSNVYPDFNPSDTTSDEITSIEEKNEMASYKDQLVKAVHQAKEKWHKIEDSWKHQVKSLLSKAAAEKERAVIEDEQRQEALMNEKNAVMKELDQMKQELDEEQEERLSLIEDVTMMAETNQQVVKAVMDVREEWHRTKETMKQHVESLVFRTAAE